MKKYSLLLVCLVFSFVVMAQKAVISFDEKSHDFGKVKEEDGKITHVFDFINKGNSPMVISRVQASCGCTTPIWTKEPIEPGKKGSITVTYNPAGRPGTFTKTITVYSNATEEQTTLIIHGDVISKQSSENSAYPVNIGGLALKAKVVQMNNIEKGKVQTRVLDIQNSAKGPLKVSIDNIPTYLTAVVSPEILKPNEVGKITFTFNSKICNQWGPVADEVFLVVNGIKKTTDDFKVLIVSNIVEDFSKLTLDQKRMSPILEIPERTLNLGILKSGAKKTGKFKVNNKGQNTLEIRRIINSNRELVVKAQRPSVAGGKSSEILVALNSKNLTPGDYKKSYTLQTNDPENPYVILIISWKIQ